MVVAIYSVRTCYDQTTERQQEALCIKETLTCILSTDNLTGCYTATPGMYVVQ